MRTTNKLQSRRLALHIEAKRHDPVTLDHEDAKWDWLHMIALSPLPATTRLVAHTLCLHGRTNGSNIYPSTRGLGDEANLTETAICKHLALLTTQGYLLPYFQRGRAGQSWARTLYQLTLPRTEFDRMKTKPWVDDPTWTPDEGTQRRRARSTQGTPPREVPSLPEMAPDGHSASTVFQPEGTPRDEKGTLPDAEGTPRRVEKALNGVESSLTSKSHNLVSHVSVAPTTAENPVGLQSDSPLAEAAAKARKAIADAEEREQTRKRAASINRLLDVGNDPADVARMLKQSGVSLEEVQREVRSRSAGPRDATP